MSFQWTDHSKWQAARRGLSHDELEYILFFASKYHRAGALIFYLKQADLPASDQRRDFACRLVGTAVVMGRDQRTIITVWRNRRKGLKHIRCKQDRTRFNEEYWQ